MSGNRCSRSYSYLSKRQKLVIAPVKIKRMVPRWMIPSDANTGGASALRSGARGTGPPLSGGRRNAGKLNPGAARFSHHKVYLWALARSFWRKLNHGAGPCGNMEVQCFKRAAVHNLQCKMMQTDVRILDLPERHDADCQRDIILHCNLLALARVYEPRR
jgi:hypothetical protein